MKLKYIIYTVFILILLFLFFLSGFWHEIYLGFFPKKDIDLDIVRINHYFKYRIWEMSLKDVYAFEKRVGGIRNKEKPYKKSSLIQEYQFDHEGKASYLTAYLFDQEKCFRMFFQFGVMGYFEKKSYLNNIEFFLNKNFKMFMDNTGDRYWYSKDIVITISSGWTSNVIREYRVGMGIIRRGIRKGEKWLKDYLGKNYDRFNSLR